MEAAELTDQIRREAMQLLMKMESQGGQSMVQRGRGGVKGE